MPLRGVPSEVRVRLLPRARVARACVPRASTGALRGRWRVRGVRVCVGVGVRVRGRQRARGCLRGHVRAGGCVCPRGRERVHERARAGGRDLSALSGTCTTAQRPAGWV